MSGGGMGGSWGGAGGNQYAQGGDNNVQGGVQGGSGGLMYAGQPGNQGTGLAGAMQAFLGSGPSIQGPNANAYNQQMNQASQAGGQFYGTDTALAHQALGQAGPQVGYANQGALNGDVSQLQGLAGQYGTLATQGSQLAQQQFQQAQDQSIAQQMAMARSAQGGAIGQAGAMRSAQENAANQQAQAVAASGAMQGQIQLQGLQGLGNTYGQIAGINTTQMTTQQQQLLAQAQLEEQQRQANYGFAQGMYGLGQSGSLSGMGLSQNALNAYTNENLQAQGVQIQSQQQANQLAMQGVGMVGGAAEGMLASDESLKVMDPSPHGDALADAFLASIDPHSFRYKDSRDEPDSGTMGGKYLGVVAQHLERVPELGSQLVRQTDRGKMVNVVPLTSALAGGLGRLAARVRDLEGKK